MEIGVVVLLIAALVSSSREIHRLSDVNTAVVASYTFLKNSLVVEGLGVGPGAAMSILGIQETTLLLKAFAVFIGGTEGHAFSQHLLVDAGVVL